MGDATSLFNSEDKYSYEKIKMKPGESRFKPQNESAFKPPIRSDSEKFPNFFVEEK